ncbi:phospholipid carrier-dependent glycosyltransferase [Nocardioides sp. TRM66260-LWL]|uniref:dolichyl-phosphate-mannose--protein mannosyltransferase n=1 Tax=Nocardioides sp. TRM66260-LWL TaxID=2874478 RepID=UPI001CC3DED9|nr:phospholipid carrier-dependent glycosyltransferase [Nocardioides sp. TRM66260-LWL]MBZ5734650.1 phospholipid carrier-dependent glycosyltransferase [Nocardioides sp. TRM66260-LWL]
MSTLRDPAETATSPTAPTAGRVPLERDAHGRPRPTAWARARGRLALEDPLVGWLSALALTLLAFALRLWHLGTPREFEFDETYYAKDAWSLINQGYVHSYVPDANERILSGQTTGLWESGPSMIVHPEVGKWLIGLGEKALGMDPFGWRIASAIAGSLLVLVMIRLARRVTGSTLLGLVAGVLIMFDGLAFVLSRLALLDVFLALFLLCATSCLVNDRFWLRARLADLVPERVGPGGWGPVRAVLWRPWLLAAGVCFGLALGTKWTAIYPLAAFGVLVVAWSAGARRSFGVRLAWLRSLVVDGLPAFGYLVVVGLVVYVATWTGWLVHASAYERDLSSTQYTQYVASQGCDGESVRTESDPTKRWPTATEPDARGLGEVVQSLRSLWYYHQDVYTFHTHFLDCATHSYASNPAGWLLLNRPVGVSADTGIQPGERGCTAAPGSDCLRQVLLIGTPAVWWGGIVALVYALLVWVGRRDWRFGLAVVGVASTWLPWLQYGDRPIFLYYLVATLPFVVLALTLGIGHLIGPDRRTTPRRTIGTILAGTYVVLVVANFAWFWPIFTDGLLTHAQWFDRIWFSRWI